MEVLFCNSMQIKQALLWAYETLVLKSPSARLDAEVLLSYVLKKPNTFLLAHNETEIGFFALRHYKKMVEKRKTGMPVAYLTGHKEFYFLDFEVSQHVLIPRPDTEILVEAATDYIKSAMNSNLEFRISDLLLLDVGTGSGCIPISILKNIPDLTGAAIDISGSALDVAKRNAKKHGVGDRLRFFKSDLLKNLPPNLFKRHTLIVTANLPYIPTDFAVNPEVHFEPGISLYGGTDGVEIYKRLASELLPLKPKAIFVELFDFQKAALASHLPGYELKKTEPMTGQARLLFLEKIG